MEKKTHWANFFVVFCFLWPTEGIFKWEAACQGLAVTYKMTQTQLDFHSAPSLSGILVSQCVILELLEVETLCPFTCPALFFQEQVQNVPPRLGNATIPQGCFDSQQLSDTSRNGLQRAQRDWVLRNSKCLHGVTFYLTCLMRLSHWVSRGLRLDHWIMKNDSSGIPETNTKFIKLQDEFQGGRNGIVDLHC